MASNRVLKKSSWFRQPTPSPSAPPTTQKSEDCPSWTVYGSAKELPFDKFIKIACEKDLKPLIISGEPPQEVLEEAWLNIYVEYNDTIDPEFKVGLEGTVQTEVLRTKVKIVAAVIEQMMPLFNPENPNSPRLFIYNATHVDTLRKLGFSANSFKLDENDVEACQKDLMRIATRTKSWVLQINIKDKEKADGQSRNNVSLDEVFTRMIIELGKYFGFKVKPSEYTTYEFAVAFNGMQKANAHGRPDK